MAQDQVVVFLSAVFASVQAMAGTYGESLFILSFGIAVYAAIFGTLYTYLSKKVLYNMRHEDTVGISGVFMKMGNLVSFAFKYTVLFPAITFVWFALLSISLFLLSRTAELELVFTMSISVVAAVRILAYYREDISVDLAKMLPLALLAVLLVEPGLFSFETVKARVMELANSLPQFAPFILFAVVLEWVLRLLYTAVRRVRAVED